MEQAVRCAWYGWCSNPEYHCGQGGGYGHHDEEPCAGECGYMEVSQEEATVARAVYTARGLDEPVPVELLRKYVQAKVARIMDHLHSMREYDRTRMRLCPDCMKSMSRCTCLPF